MVTHIGPHGPGECRAKAGRCPFSPENHFETYEEALSVWENSLTLENPPVALKKKQLETYESVSEAKAEVNLKLNEQMTEKFGENWAARLQMDDLEVYRGFTFYNQEVEEYERKLNGMKFAPRSGEATLEAMTNERAIINSWLVDQTGRTWEELEYEVEEPEFNSDLRDIYYRGEVLDRQIASLKE